MLMNRFFIDKNNIHDNIATIQGEDIDHIRRVLRLSVGDYIELCDSEGYDYIAKLQDISKDLITAGIEKSYLSVGEPNVNVSVYQAVPKGDKMDTVIQKCVELGVNKIIPVITDRTIVKMDSFDARRKKTLRWQKISEEAAKQSKRGKIPGVSMPVDFSEAASMEDASSTEDTSLKIIFWEEERCLSLRYIVEHAAEKNRNNIAIFIGPEGGFTEDEIFIALRHGWKRVTLGPRILRTETVGMAALSAIMFYMEEMEWK